VVFRGKALDSFCPMGPVLVTAEEIPDPRALGIRFRVNGEVCQDATPSRAPVSAARRRSPSLD